MPSLLRSPALRPGTLVLGLLLGCGDDTAAPVVAQPGYVLSVVIPGITDTTFRGDSLYWRFLSGPNPAGDGVLRDLTLELVVLNPPAPLRPPLAFEVRWSQFHSALPTTQTYALGLTPPADVLLQASSNLGIWAASQGQLTLTSVSATRLAGTLKATLVPVYPPASTLPAATVQATFLAMHSPDLSAGP